MKRGVRDLPAEEIRGRRALVRVDYNVPLEGGAVADPRRIRASYPTLDVLLGADARPVLCSHLGRPGGEADPNLSLGPVVDFLTEDRGHPVRFVAPADGEDAERASRALSTGELLLLENTRFHAGEKANDPAFARRLARAGDFYVNDAFAACHRSHASVVGVTEHLRPAVAGLLVQRELRMLDAVRRDPERPFVLVVGGAKISDKLQLLEAFLDRADAVLVGGAMANTFLAARGVAMADSRLEPGELETARHLMDRAGDRLRLPTDVVVAAGPDADEGRTVPVERGVPDGEMALDVGPATREAFGRAVREARSLFWNGPMGFFERAPFAAGTVAVARAAADATDRGATTVIGGGDSARALHEAGLEDAVTHVSTGGGAALVYVATGSLPGIEALDDP